MAKRPYRLNEFRELNHSYIFGGLSGKRLAVTFPSFYRILCSSYKIIVTPVHKLCTVGDVLGSLMLSYTYYCSILFTFRYLVWLLCKAKGTFAEALTLFQPSRSCGLQASKRALSKRWILVSAICFATITHPESITEQRFSSNLICRKYKLAIWILDCLT